ncbi:LacI family DNA-binding transcriptional regulator [Pseudoduganella lutea]|uniref:LacI family transcriptional regulator n=1 Tax=Pseudoduganella lutea TaxID=321985 RepID=A0A4P6KU19_9BURK|nr:LacI family DNA-binding transcriptional regulator [Pseudoduganella lutea]QBE61912.1 LacI family transcriptional regulator [Pseudoduganella lutea]
MMRKAVTLQQVADAAGVSLNTASRAIRADRYVSDEARARVQEAAERLQYRPNVLARRMRGDKARLLGIFVNAIGWGVVHELVDHISEEARRLDFDLVVFSAQNFHDRRRIGTSDLLADLCDGLLMLLPNREDKILDVLERERGNCVLVSFAAREIGLPVVSVDNRAGGRTATEHLLGLGHRRIAFIHGSHATGQSTERQKGYVDALEAAGIAPDPALMVLGNFNPVETRAATTDLLDLAEPPTAIFAANDGMALTVLEVLRARGLAVPADISVIGFDDMPLASYAQPPLTTLRQPSHDIAVRAVHRLLAMIDGEPFDPARELIAAELVVRASTGPLRRN